jgi:hypothetical protein
MRELLPGLSHWSTFHAPIGAPVSSYFVAPAGVVIDPKVPEEGIDALPGTPQRVVMTTGLHDRDVPQFADAFGIPVCAPREARDRLGDTLAFEPFGDGDEIAPGVTAIRVGSLCPDEYALHLAVGEGAIAFADAVIRYGGRLSFVPDSLMGEDPEAVKAGLMEALHRILTRDFDHLLFAHGEPLIGGGKAALQDFVT